MTAFRYVAYTPEGKRRKGTLAADSRGQAAQLLKAKGLFAAEIEARAERATPGRGRKRLAGFRRGRGLTTDERAIFTRQLAVLISADLAVDMALDTVGASGGSQRLESVAVSTRAALHEGETLADALAMADPGFPPYYIAAIAAGETSGELPRVVEELANHLETMGADQSKIATALIYPAFVAAVSVLVCGILVTNVAPEIVTMFEATGQPLPAITTTLLAAVDWLERWWLACLIGLLGGTVLFLAALRVPAFRDRWHALLLRLPIVGRLMRLSAAQQYLQTLALVISSRQTALDAVGSATRVLSVSRFVAQSQRATTDITRGESLSGGLAHLEFIPPVCRQLISAGEQSAKVGNMTERAARLVESWLENDRKRIAALLDPLLMMVVGAFVLVVVLAILLPIFDMQSMVS